MARAPSIKLPAEGFVVRRRLLLGLLPALLAGMATLASAAPTVAAGGAVARELGLLASGGTDYHGDDEPYAEAIAETWVPPAIAEEVLAALRIGSMA